jgi:hypothetical protein
MTDEDIRRVVREAVHETLSGLGMAAHEQHELQADFLYIRKMRKGSEATGRNIRNTAITVIIPTVIYILWQAIKGEIWR